MDLRVEAAVSSTGDAFSWYWQVEIKDEDQYKTASNSLHGLHRFARMPSGLRNAPDTVQRAMDAALLAVKWQSLFVYLDNFVVFFCSATDHINNVNSLLTVLRDTSATLKPKKCSFSIETIDYLGHSIF